MRILRQGRLSVEVELAELSVIMLSDGETAMPEASLRGPDGAPLGEAALAGAERREGGLRLPVRAFVVRGRAGCLLIDAGAGRRWHAGLGRLPEALLEAGVGPGEITAVALTHTHIDHIGGLVGADGGPAFPNAARVFVAIEEMSAMRAAKGMAPILPRLMPLEQGDGPLSGVTAVNAPGHSPGHMAFLVEGRLLIWGDLVHHAAIQFAAPEVTWVYDSDPAEAGASRRALMEQAVEAGWMVAGAHLPDPGIGRITRSGTAYAFHPLSEA